MISLPALFLGGVAALAALVWLAVSALRLGQLTLERRAVAVSALAVTQPIVILLLSARTASEQGAISQVTHRIALAGQALNGAMLIAAASVVLAPKRRAGRRERWLLASVWAMVLALYVGNTLSPNPGSMRYEAYFAAALTAVAIGFDDWANFVALCRRVLRLIVAISLGATLIAPRWAFIGQGLSGYDRTIFGIPRLTGLSPHPNTLSAIAVAALLLEIGYRRGRTWVRFSAAAAATACVLLTQSNTGYVAAFAGVATIVAVRHTAYRRALLFGASVALALLVVSPHLIVPSQLANSDYVTSLSGRATIWRLSLDEWERHPVTGYGPSMFQPSYLTTHFPPGLQVTNGHDQLIQTLTDSGLLGAFALLSVLVGTVACAWHSRRLDSGLSLGLVAAFWTFATTETPLRAVDVVAIPALVTLGIAAVASHQVERAHAASMVASRQSQAPALPTQVGFS